MSDIAYFTPERQLPRTGLITFGVILIVVGVLTGMVGVLGVVGALFGVSRAGAAGQPPHFLATMLVSMLVYFIAAVALSWLGIGSCTGQRWVRPIALITSVAAFCFGLLAVAGTVAVLLFTSGLTNNPHTSPSFFFFGILIATSVEALLFLVLPAAMFWFYRRAETRDVLQALDLCPTRWTDGIPVPLLGWAVGWFVFGFTHLFNAALGRTVLFAVIVHGIVAVVVVVVAALLMMYAGWLGYRRRIFGWWLAIGLIAVGCASAIAFAIWGDPTALLQTATHSTTLPINSERVMRGSEWGGVVFSLIVFAYGLYVRRFFSNVPEPLPVPSLEPVHAELG